MSLTSENGTQLTMPVMPAGGMGGYGMGGFGGDGWWGILFLIAILCGGWGGLGGFGGMGGMMGMWPFLCGGFGGMGGAYPAESILQRSLDTQTIIGKLDGVNQGLCDGFYAQSNAMNSLGMNMMQGFSQAELSRCNQQAALMQQLYQMGYQQKDCCCQTQRAIDGVNYNMTTNTCALQNTMNNNTRDIIDNANANSRAILDYLCQDKISTLQNENQALRLAASQSNQNAVLMAAMDANKAEILRRTGAECPTPAYVVQPPTPVNFPTNCCGQFSGWNNGCGCNSGCGC